MLINTNYKQNVASVSTVELTSFQQRAGFNSHDATFFSR